MEAVCAQSAILLRLLCTRARVFAEQHYRLEIQWPSNCGVYHLGRHFFWGGEGGGGGWVGGGVVSFGEA